MEVKEMVSELLEMGFTVDEAISLAKGNYRTVPDPKPKQDPEPEPKPEPKQEPDPEPKPEPKQEPDPEPKPEPKPDAEPWNRIEKALAKLTESVINSNINNIQQPAPMNAQDVLGLMLEPGKPAERSK